ncbi:MAG: phytanoyl-CoA dioxygenase family protein, partial [Kiloniellales bacterium]
MSLTQEQVREFKEKGFIVIKGFFGPDEMAKLSAWLDELRDRQPAEGEEAKYFETSPISGENILVRIENVIGDRNREASDLLISDKAREALTQLLGEAPMLFK